MITFSLPRSTGRLPQPPKAKSRSGSIPRPCIFTCRFKRRNWNPRTSGIILINWTRRCWIRLAMILPEKRLSWRTFPWIRLFMIPPTTTIISMCSPRPNYPESPSPRPDVTVYVISAWHWRWTAIMVSPYSAGCIPQMSMTPK